MTDQTFDDYLLSLKLARTTRDSYARAASRWGDDPVGWLAGYVTDDTPQGTLVMLRAAARQWLTWRGREAEAARLPRSARHVQRSYREGLTADELRDFLQAARSMLVQPHGTIVELLARCGLRISEAVALRADAFQREGGREGLRVVGKGNKVRWVPLPAGLHATLTAAAADSPNGYLFPGKRGHLHPGTVRKHLRAMQTALAEAGLPGVHPHKLRHTFASLLFDRGAELRVVQDLLGHADPKVTARYAQPTARRLGEAVDLLDDGGEG